MAERQAASTDVLDCAIRIAREAHAAQKDKAGEPFIAHVERVAAAVEGTGAKTIAYLHDVVEKGEGWTPERLRQAGFPEAIVRAVESLTRRPEETSDEFARRAASDPLARPVKCPDLEDNLLQARRAGPNPGKYRRGWRFCGRPMDIERKRISLQFGGRASDEDRR